MRSFLREHALKNVWCTPDQDIQHIFAPARLTPAGGSKGTFKSMSDTYDLPNTTDRFHVYQLGAYDPILLNLVDERNVWRPFSNICRNKNLIADMYLTNGIQYPRFGCWLLKTYNDNVVIAVMLFPNKLPSLDDEQFFVRLYSNSYFTSVRNTTDGITDEIRVYGKLVKNATDINEIQTRWNLWNNSIGHTYGFVNGYFTDVISPVTYAIGDVVEIVKDTTIYKVVDYACNTLDQFDSVLDNKRKYILHGTTWDTDTIEYRDDIDFFLYVIKPNTVKQGVFFHKNQEDAVRMLTHKDYTVPIPYIDAYTVNVPVFHSQNDLRMRMHIRKSGYKRPLVNEHHRIKELYKLTPELIRGAMTGVNSVLDEWRASELEGSDYTRIMRRYSKDITGDMVVNAYGYNAISKLIADTPNPAIMENGIRQAKLKEGNWDKASVWEFNANGNLLGYYNHNDNDYYPARNPSTRLCEALMGGHSNSTGAVLGEPTSTYNPLYDHRFYVCPKVGGIPNNEWIDATDTDMYAIVDDQVVWDVNSATVYTQVRTDEKVIAYTFILDPQDGVLFFNIISAEERSEGFTNDVLWVPPGKLEIWMNGNRLVKDIDYIEKYPTICIFSRPYWVDEQNQVIVVRGSGFCVTIEGKLVPEPITQSGFVDYGVLSRNGIYDIRDDKVVQVTVGGRILQNSDVKFMEDNPTLVNASALNGLPYCISDHYVPLRDFTDTTTTAERNKSKDLDERLSDYLTVTLPEPEPDIDSLNSVYYELYSPFCGKVIWLMKTGSLTDEEITQELTAQYVTELLEDHLHLLDYDPIRQNKATIQTVVYPHHLRTNVAVTPIQWRFINRVVELFLESKIDLTRSIVIQS